MSANCSDVEVACRFDLRITVAVVVRIIETAAATDIECADDERARVLVNLNRPTTSTSRQVPIDRLPRLHVVEGFEKALNPVRNVPLVVRMLNREEASRRWRRRRSDLPRAACNFLLCRF